MKLLFSTLVLLSTTALAAPMGPTRAWMRISDPLRMSASETLFSSLPLTGKSADAQKYWSSDYWARNKGGINYRWNAVRPSGFNLRSPTRTEALAMTQSQLGRGIRLPYT